MSHQLENMRDLAEVRLDDAEFYVKKANVLAQAVSILESLEQHQVGIKGERRAFNARFEGYKVPDAKDVSFFIGAQRPGWIDNALWGNHRILVVEQTFREDFPKNTHFLLDVAFQTIEYFQPNIRRKISKEDKLQRLTQILDRLNRQVEIRLPTS